MGGTKHSKNNTARGFHSSHERQIAGYGSKEQRLGRDSMLKFGYCGLRLTPAENPVCTPGGIIYSRDAIIEHMANQRLVVKKQERQFKKQEMEKHAEAMKKEAEDEQAVYDNAEQVEVHQAVAPQIDEEIKNRVVKSLNVGFWVPVHAPTAEPSVVKKPEQTLRCPVTNQALRLKDLIPFKMEWEPIEPDSRDRTERPVCAVTRDPIIHQKVVVLKKTGIVMLESCLKTLVYPTMTCPITGKKIKKKDIIKLVPGATGFCAHNKVVGKKYQQHNAGSGFAGRGEKMVSRI